MRVENIFIDGLPTEGRGVDSFARLDYHASMVATDRIETSATRARAMRIFYAQILGTSVLGGNLRTFPFYFSEVRPT